MSNCLTCDSLLQAALEASRQYHDLMGTMETAHISRDNDLAEELQIKLSTALSQRVSAIEALTNHRQSHAITPGATKKAATASARDAPAD